MGRRRASSSRWLAEHARDAYVLRARAEGYRSRAAYKLQELARRERLLRPGQRVLDLGAAPGGWSQVAAGMIGPRGRVVAIDLLEMAPLDGVTVLQGDVRDRAVWPQLAQALGGLADLVISDMAPNLSGIKDVDQAAGAELARVGLEAARRFLKPGGGMLIKVFAGGDLQDLTAEYRAAFERVGTRKPDASRDRSRELYLLATGLRAEARLADPAGLQ